MGIAAFLVMLAVIYTLGYFDINIFAAIFTFVGLALLWMCIFAH